MKKAETITSENWQWRSCKWGMVYRNVPKFGIQDKWKMEHKQDLCSQTCFWLNKGVCRYSDITSHISTKKEQEVYYLVRQNRLVHAK